MRKLPDRGWELRLTVRYPDGEPYSGTAIVQPKRGGEAVQKFTIPIEKGAGVVSGLVLDPEYVAVIAGKWSGRMKDVGRQEGEVKEFVLEVERLVTVVFDPDFAGDPRPLSIQISSLKKPLSIRIGTSTWPRTHEMKHMSGPVKITYLDGKVEVASEEAVLVPGETYRFRPRIPAGR